MASHRKTSRVVLMTSPYATDLRSRAVSARGAGMDVAQDLQLVGGRRLGLDDIGGVAHRPTGVVVDLLAGDARMDRRDSHFLRLRIGLEDAEVGDELGRALGLEAKPRAVIAALAVAHRRDEVELGGKTPLRLRHDDEDLAAGRSDLGRAAAAREP